MEITPDKWQRAKAVFDAALQRPAEERHSFLTETCREDDLRAQVEQLLLNHDHAGNFLSNPAIEIAKAERFAPGAILAGRFKIVRFLGKGGMGEVFEAEDLKMFHRRVALKFLPAELSRDRQALERFEREVRAVSALDHPNICTVYEVGEDNRRPFMVMQFLEGDTLQHRISERQLDSQTVLELAIQLSDALDAAHSRGIIHRDIKPANIFLSTRGQLKVLDFGLAKQTPVPRRVQHASTSSVEATASVPEESLTSPGSALGTVAYMSPEQVSGDELDARTDLFSFGAVLYEMSTGQHAFSGRTTGLIFDAILNREPVPPRKLKSVIPTELEQIITKALEKDRDVRYQHAADIRADLKRLKRDTESGNLRALRPAHRVRPWTRLAWVLSGAAVIVVVAVAGWLWKRDSTKPSVPPIRSLAVLPLENLSHDPEQEYFADGMTEELITDLSQINALKVISRKSVMHYKNADKPISQIAQELGVDTIVEGSVRRSGDRVRISAQLIYAPTETPLWAQSYDRELKDALTVQSVLAGDIAEQIRVNIKSEQARLRSTRAVNPKALDSYLKGVYYLKKWQPQNAEKAVESFKQSILEDPKFAMAYVQLANAYAGAETNAKTVPLQREVIGKALSLDPSLADVHLALANFKLNAEYDWIGAEREYRRALELNPNHADAHNQFAGYLCAAGRFEEALKESQAAQELDDSAWFSTGQYLYFTRQYDQGIDLVKRMVEIHPDDFVGEWWRMFHMYAAKGMEVETLNSWRQTGLALGYTDTPDIVKSYSKLGYQGALRQGVNWMEVEYAAGDFDFPEPIAEIYVLLGDKDKAFYWLDKAYDERDGFLTELAASPLFDPVRSDLRYKALVKKIRFPQVTAN